MAEFGYGEFLFGDDMARSRASSRALKVGANELPAFRGEGAFLKGTHDVVFFGVISGIEVVGFCATFVNTCTFELFDNEDGKFTP